MLFHGQLVWTVGSIGHRLYCCSIRELSLGFSKCLPWGHRLPLRLLVKKITVTNLLRLGNQ